MSVPEVVPVPCRPAGPQNGFLGNLYFQEVNKCSNRIVVFNFFFAVGTVLKNASVGSGPSGKSLLKKFQALLRCRFDITSSIFIELKSFVYSHVSYQVKIYTGIVTKHIQSFLSAVRKKIIVGNTSDFFKIFKCIVPAEEVLVQDTVIASPALKNGIFKNLSFTKISIFFVKLIAKRAKAFTDIVKSRVILPSKKSTVAD